MMSAPVEEEEEEEKPDRTQVTAVIGVALCLVLVFGKNPHKFPSPLLSFPCRKVRVGQ